MCRCFGEGKKGGNGTRCAIILILRARRTSYSLIKRQIFPIFRDARRIDTISVYLGKILNRRLMINLSRLSVIIYM